MTPRKLSTPLAAVAEDSVTASGRKRRTRSAARPPAHSRTDVLHGRLSSPAVGIVADFPSRAFAPAALGKDGLLGPVQVDEEVSFRHKNMSLPEFSPSAAAVTPVRVDPRGRKGKVCVCVCMWGKGGLNFFLKNEVEYQEKNLPLSILSSPLSPFFVSTPKSSLTLVCPMFSAGSQFLSSANLTYSSSL